MKGFKIGTNVLVELWHTEIFRLLNKGTLHRQHVFPIISEMAGRQYSTKPTVKTRSSAKTHDWNRAVSDAERIVGYPTTYFSLRCLLSEEFSDVVSHLRRLVTTGHPILKTAKRLVYHDKSNMQTRGLIVLLLSKAAGHSSSCSDADTAQGRGITPRQQNLSEITEMIHTAHCIHKGILNLSPAAIPDKDDFDDLQFGNKISVLSGDFFLSNACKGLANLRNCKVVDLISESIGDFMRAEFLGEHDKQGNPLPFKGMSVTDWEEKNYLCAGSLLANSCKGTLELAGHNENIQAKGYEFGKNVALAWQAYSELQPFIDHSSHSPSAAFDLSSLPVTLHLEEHPDVIEVLRNQIGDDITNLDFTPFYYSVLEGKGIEKTKNMLQRYSETAEDILSEFGSSAASKALSNIIMALKL